jgi:hypothetical protein
MRQHRRIQTSKLALGLLAALATAPAMAQSTSAGVAGQILDAAGAPVAGAEVTITHVESGTTSRTTTDASGRYSVRGLRPGGPYTVTVNKAGQTSTEEGIFLELNSVASVNERLGEGAVTEFGTVAVTGTRLASIFNADHKGIGTSVSGRRLETAVAGSRSLDEIARLDPRITVIDATDGSISLAGVNNRYNRIQVDGMSQGDPFGLNSNGMAYTGSPISPDTIAAYDINASDYDVTSDSVGAIINAVTKSGTNEFHGSVYYAYKNSEDMVGQILSNPTDDSSKRVDYSGFDSDMTRGITFGGPIIKDTLFFFGSAEKQRVTNIGAFPNNGYASGRVTDADLAAVEAAAAKWGLEPGAALFKNAESTGLALENERYLGKIDWNITDGQRLSFTYQKTTENKPTPYDASGNNVAYSSHYYDIDSTTRNLSLQLFSDWTDSFSTELKVSRQKFDQVAGNALNQPQVSVSTPGGGTIYLGEDTNRHENEIHTKTLNVSLSAIWYVGDHTIKGGADYLRQENFDLYGRDLHGVFAFNSPAAFEAGSYTSYTRALIPAGLTLDDLGFPMKYTQISPFLQDTWQATDNLSLTYGVRVNMPDTNRAPPSLTGSTLAAYESVVGFANNSTLDNNLVEPRFSFNYAFNTERFSQLRGGVGLFQTSPPTVWIFNPYQNNGVTGRVSTNSTGGEPFEQLITDVENKSTSASLAGRPQVDAISPDFNLPSAWKYSLGYDAELPWYGIVASVDALYIKNKDAIIYTEPNTGIASTGATPIVLPDGRLGYWTNGLPAAAPASGSTYRNIAGAQTCYVSQTCSGTYVANSPAFAYNSTVLDNTDKGYSKSITFGLSKPLVNDWAWDLSFTLAKAEEVNPGNSSQATSNYQIAMVNPNTTSAAIADRSIRQTIKGSVTWDHAFFGDYKTTVTAYYTGHDGQPYSWIFGTGTGILGDVNGDNQFGYDLAYIPLVNDPNVTYKGSAEQIQAFQEFISSDSYLGAHRGEIAERNGAHSPWVNQLDLGIQQELPGFFKTHKAIVRLDISDFLNLLNNDWGLQKTVNTFNPRRNLAYVSGFTPDGKYIYDVTRAPTAYQAWYVSGGNAAPSRVSSTWSALLTLRYEF